MEIDNVLDLMVYENEQDRQEAIKYISLKGFMQYKRIIGFFIAEGYDKPSYKKVSSLYRYDKRLRDTLYKYIATIEEFIRATIGNKYEDKTNGFTITPKLGMKLKEYNSLSIALEHLMLGDLKDLVLKNKEIFNDIYIIDENLKNNLVALRDFRNKVGHHNFLLAEEYEKCIVNGKEDKTLEANIKNLQQFLPKDFQAGFANSIRGCSKGLDFPSKYVIDIQQLTINKELIKKISNQCYNIIMNDSNNFADFINSVHSALFEPNWRHAQGTLYYKAIHTFNLDIKCIGVDTEERLYNLYRICSQFNLLFDIKCAEQRKINKMSFKVFYLKFVRKYEAFTSYLLGVISVIILILSSFNAHQQDPNSWSAGLFMGLASSILAATIIMYVNKRKKKKARKNNNICDEIVYHTNKLITNTNNKFQLLQNAQENYFFNYFIDIDNLVYNFCSRTKGCGLEECIAYNDLRKFSKDITEINKKIIEIKNKFIQEGCLLIALSEEERAIATDYLIKLKRILNDLKWQAERYMYDLTQETVKLEDTLY